MRLLLLVLALCSAPAVAFADGGVKPDANSIMDASVDASAVVEAVTPLVSPAMVDPATTSTAVVNAVASRDWQVAIAGLLSLAWLVFLRFFADTESFFHTPKGKALVTAVSSVCGAVIPLLQTHTFSLAMLVSAVTAAGFTFATVAVSKAPATPPTA